jgi:tRNA nucleotidyltransferase/poly(A) polymerase
VWLVGGAVRDLLLGRPTTDFDFAVQGDGLAVGRRLANALGADYYDLDASRSTGRLLLTTGEGRKTTFDFASVRGGGLLQDLALRDFTVNAMAIALSTPEGVRLDPSGTAGALIDPLHGSGDLRQKRLKACSAGAIADDPIRAVRAVRLSVDLELSLDPDTAAQSRRAAAALGRVSPERMRDEFFRILDCRRPAAGLRLLDRLGLLEEILPDLGPLRGLAQPAPHAFDAFDHSLATVEHLADLGALLSRRSGRQEAGNLTQASVLARFQPYQTRLAAHLAFSPSFGRPRRGLLLWSALLHDIGKAKSYTVDEQGSIRFLGHETIGSRLAVEASRRLRLSTVEQAEVEMTILHHMRLGWLEADGEPTRRAIYRFFRAAEATGVSVVLLSLADLQGHYVPPVPSPAWQRRIETAGALLQAWFDERPEVVAPVPLLNGDEIMRMARLGPGPEVGRVVEELREAQAAGELTTRQQAEAFVRGRQNP